MKKVVLSFLLILISFVSIFAKDVETYDSKKLKIVKTEFFDFIYPEISQRAAAILVEHADDFYRELATYYKLNYPVRFTVTIYPNTDLMNANFSAFPYNRIVLYDTMCLSDLNVFSENLLSVFKHELAHGISYNLHNGFWNGVKKVFGDVVNPGYLITTSGVAESAAVMAESSQGEGRLNSEYGNKHSVKQAIIEGRLLKHWEFQGARDIFPSNVFYSFSSEFFNWVEKKYGTENYVKFWYKCRNFQGLTYFSIFKSVYGFSISEALDNFYEEFNVPDVEANPAELDFVKYFGEGVNKTNYSCLVSSKDKIAYVNSEATGVFVCKKVNSENYYSKPKRVLTESLINSISLSNDGKYLTVSYYSKNYLDYKTKTMIVDLENNHRFYVSETGILHGIVIGDCEKEYFVGLKTYSQFSSFNIYELVKTKSGKIKKAVLVDSIKNKFNDSFFNLKDDGKGNIYFIHKEALDFYISYYDLKEKKWNRIAFPKEQIELADFSVVEENENTQLYFSWAEKGTMPRLGIATIKENKTEFTFFGEDISGGIFNPIKVDEKNIVYIGNFFEGSNIFIADISNCKNEKITVQNQIINIDEEDKNQKKEIPLLENAEDFSLWNYHRRGVLIPFGLANTYAINEANDELNGISSVLGISYVTSTPWVNPIFIASLGYNVISNSWVINADVNNQAKMTGTGLFQYDIAGSVEFDKNGYKQTFESLSFASKITLPNCYYINFSEGINFFEGRQTDLSNEDYLIDFYKKLQFVPSTNQHNVFIHNQVGIGFGKNFYTGKFERAGFGFATVLDSVYCAETDSIFEAKKNYNNVAVSSVFYIPKLLPLDNSFDMCINLPSYLSVELFPSSSYFAKVSGSSLLFSKELQWSPNWFGVIYFNRFFTRITYDGVFSSGENDSWAIGDISSYVKDFSDGNMNYYDELKLSVGVYVSPNFGTFTSLMCSLFMDFKYRFFPEPTKRTFDISVGFGI